MTNENNKEKKIKETPPSVIKQSITGIPPKSLLQILWRSRWIILFTTVLAITATAVYLSKEIPIFQSTSTIYVEQSGPRIISEMEEDIMMKSNNYLYTQARLLKSEPILSAIFSDPNIKQMKTLNTVEDPINYLKENLDVIVGSMDEIISISFESPYPKEAAQMVNAIVQSYINFHISQKRSTAADVLEILQSQKEIRNQELVEKLNEMMEFKKSNPALAFEDNILQQLKKLSTDLTEAQLVTIEKKSAYDSTKELIGEPNSLLRQYVETQVAEGVYGPISSERKELKSRLEQLQRQKIVRLRQLNPVHPGIEILENEISYIKKQIATLDNGFVQTRLAIEEQEYLEAKDIESQIQKYFEEQRLQALSLNEQLAQYTILQSEYEQTKKDYELINDRIEDVNVAEDTGALNIIVLETARPANKPSDSDHIRFLSFALVMGFMSGSGLAILRDCKDQKIHSPEETSLRLGLPILGMIPSMPKRESIVTKGQKVHLEPDSPVAEAYRTIRTAVFFGALNKKAKTILVTSAREFEGKTTLASNLAIAMAQTGQNTLLLDADFRNPMQYKIFETDNKGIVSLFSGITTLENAIHPTEIEGLELLPCKTQLINPSEIINSKSFANLIELLSSKYDRIIIDSPPVVPVTDSKILAVMCDVTILLIRAEKTTKKMSQLARNGLQSVGANILGLVVNDVPKKSQYGYYENLHKYYGYRSTSKKRGDN